MILTIICIALLALGTGYTFLLHHRAPDQLWNWYHGLIATLLSVLLAVVTGFWVYHQQQSQSDERERASIRQLLQREFSDIHIILTKSEPIQVSTGTKQYKLVVGYVQPLATERAAQSDLLDTLDTMYLMHLAQTIRAYNVAVQFFLGSLNGSSQDPGYTERLEFAIKNVETMRIGIVREIERLANRFAIPLVGWE